MNINVALNVLYQRHLSSGEQLLREMLRVKLTLKKLKQLEENRDILSDKDKLFQFMKRSTEEGLGFFPADRDDFFDFFTVLKDIDLIDFTLEIYKNAFPDTVITPLYLNKFIRERIAKLQPEKILITEADKHLTGLREIIESNRDARFTLTTDNKIMHILLQLAFADYKNVRINFESIYNGSLQDDEYDYIYTLPVFSHKPEELSRDFLTRDSCSIAMENMLGHLNKKGTLDIIVPAKITFAGLGNEKLRAYISENYQLESIYILPEGIFRPVIAFKTYLISISAESKDEVIIGTLELHKNALEIRKQKSIETTELSAREDWRIELLLADNETMKRFRSSSLQKVKLKDVAEVFRGKSILKKDTSCGSIAVLNISNLENGEIDYQNMDTIAAEERKVKRFELLTGDVVLSCRGTIIKSAVFAAQNRTVIASANLIVIRPKAKVTGKFIHIFLESPMGLAMIKSFQRGTTVMNINFADIMEIEIPLLSIEKQEELIKNYESEVFLYRKIIRMAKKRLVDKKREIYEELL
jgi:hypothetical protein